MRAVRARSERVEEPVVEPVAAATPTTGMATRARSDPTEIVAAERERKLSAQEQKLQRLSREAQRQQNQAALTVEDRKELEEMRRRILNVEGEASRTRARLEKSQDRTAVVQEERDEARLASARLQEQLNTAKETGGQV